MQLTRPLIAFAFLAEKFEQTGDIAQGLMPLFAPIIREHEGKEFSASSFATGISEYYGIKVHPWAVEDWLGRLEKEGLVEKIGITSGVFSYRYVKSPDESKPIDERDIRGLLDAFLAHANKKLTDHGLSIPKETIEKGFVDRLVRMEFLNIILKPDTAKELPTYSTSTLRLPKSPEEALERERQDREARLDFLCADFILNTSNENLQLFEMLLQIACGALVAEVILDFQVPAQKVELKSLTIYLDAPFIMDLLDLSYAENVKYSGELFRQLKETAARVAVFPHSLDEIRGAIKAPLDRFEHGEPVTGPTGTRLHSSAFRAYARSILGGREPEMKSLGIDIAGTSTFKSAQSLQSFAETEEEELSQRIGFYENASAKLRDAGSIANIIRLRQRADIPMQNLAASRAIFLTRNSRLANLSATFLIGRGVIGERSVPPCITDRYMAGLLWISQGGKGKELSRYRLLANCASAVSPRRDVLKRMHGFLSQVDEVKARHFQALMTNNKAAHYLMSKALGDATLVTKDNFEDVYEEVQRIAAEKVTKEKDQEIEKLHVEYGQIVKTKEEELQSTKNALQTKLSQTDMDAAQAVQKAQNEAYTADEERLKTQLQVREEQRRADALKQKVESLQAEVDRKNRHSLLLAVRDAKKAQLFAQLKVTAWFVVISVVLACITMFAPIFFGQKSLGTTLALFLTIALGGVFTALQFWVFPERLFGAYVTRQRDATLVRKARELEVADIVDSYRINWDLGTIE